MGESPGLTDDVRTVVDRMTDRDWDGLILQLGRYALYKSRRFYWRTGNAGELPYGEMTESIVSKAVLLWLTGRRRWNRDEYTDLQTFLQGVIDSLLSHAAASADNRTIGALDVNDQPLHIVRMTPERELLDKERSADAELLLAEIVRQAQDDAVVTEIINAIRNGAGTRREIVRVTGRSADVIDNGLKRLRRIGAHVARERADRESGSYEHQKAR